VYPVLFTIRGFEVTSFGAILGVAALVALWSFRRELQRSRLPPAATDAALVGLLGGVAGAKLMWAIEFSREEPFVDLLFSRGGLSWFGGLLGGVAAGVWMVRRQRIPLLPVLAAASPALALGHAIGRVGCFMVGDDYGRPSDVPWAVAFPEGRPPTTVPVHPTQLYETAALVAIAFTLVRLRRRGGSDRFVFGTYLVLAGGVRFLIEFVRVNAPILGPFTLAQVFSFTVVCIGLLLFFRDRRLR
jgi:phosphatidylglycerol---prolipoprotein diacylglyceryl transferase